MVSRISPTTTYLRSGEAMNCTALLPCGPAMLSVPSFEPLKVVESLRPWTVTVAVRGRLFFLRKYFDQSVLALGECQARARHHEQASHGETRCQSVH